MSKRILPKELENSWDYLLEWEFRLLILLVLWEIVLPFMFFDAGLGYAYFLQLSTLICISIFHYIKIYKKQPPIVTKMFDEIKQVNANNRKIRAEQLISHDGRKIKVSPGISQEAMKRRNTMQPKGLAKTLAVLKKEERISSSNEYK